MVAILSRNMVSGIRRELPETNKLNGDKIENPYPHNAPGLVSFYFLMHNRRSWQPRRQWKTYLREAKCLLNKYEFPVVEESVRKAASVSKHPFGFKFIEKMVKENGSKNYCQS